ncbi:MAG TPA: CBS domain-containing protein [Pelomicrobium sp.]|nr:CBS domain-containing protein [Pelomicrobium sp.]
MNVQEVMTANPAYCTPDTPIATAAKAMVDKDCGALPVVDNEDTMVPVGIITDRDITARLVAKSRNPLESTVRDAMTATTVSVQPSTEVDDASRRMQDNQLRRLLVVDDDGRCVGMVSLADLAGAASAQKAGQTLQDVSRPIGHASTASR